jgi:hypothetical protein
LVRRATGTRIPSGQLLALLTFAAIALGVLTVPIADAAPRKCPKATALDSVCRAQGSVFKELDPLPMRRLVPWSGETSLSASPGALAWVSFANQARCELGASSSLSQIETRPPGALFSQLYGRTKCKVYGREGKVEFLCEITGGCPAQLTIRGEFIARELRRGQARAAEAEGFLRRTRIVVCSGFARVRVETEGALAEIGGGATGNNEFVALITEYPGGSIDLRGGSRYNPRSSCRD